MTKDNYQITTGKEGPILSIYLGIFLLLLNAAAHAGSSHREQSIFSAAAFGPDKRLWRLTPSQNFMAVDYSLDDGKTFSRPVAINQQAQTINLWDENPPTISVDKNGKIYVLYFADDKQANTSFFSQSADGEHFSEPVKISANADKDYQYQTEMLVDADSNIHFVWHDVRDKPEYQQLGGGDLSLYHASLNPDNSGMQPPENRIAKNICSCCRSSLALDVDGGLVVLARYVYPGNIRDHGLLKLPLNQQPEQPWRVTFDEWRLEGCPTHGPALSISRDGRYHMAWFTLGPKRTGLFYAWSDNQGKKFSTPLAFGHPGSLPSRPDVLALGKQLVLAWKEFDGANTQVLAMRSNNRGKSWSKPIKVAETQSASAHPALISDGKRIYLSWNSLETGFRLIPIK